MQTAQAQHTPGPWNMDPEGEHGIGIEAANGELICSDAVGEGNARLIAAAPDLLEAVQRYLVTLDKYGDAPSEPLRQALAKAIGPNATR